MKKVDCQLSKKMDKLEHGLEESAAVVEQKIEEETSNITQHIKNPGERKKKKPTSSVQHHRE